MVKKVSKEEWSDTTAGRIITMLSLAISGGKAITIHGNGAAGPASAHDAAIC